MEQCHAALHMRCIPYSAAVITHPGYCLQSQSPVHTPPGAAACCAYDPNMAYEIGWRQPRMACCVHCAPVQLHSCCCNAWPACCCLSVLSAAGKGDDKHEKGVADLLIHCEKVNNEAVRGQISKFSSDRSFCLYTDKQQEHAPAMALKAPLRMRWLSRHQGIHRANSSSGYQLW